VLILDTDLISTVVYARHYYENVPHWLEVAARERLADLYLLLDIDVDWVADGVRDQPQARAGIHKRFQEQLRDFGARVVEIRGLGPARLEAALRTIEGHLATRT
jgi:nicotinamide riboside kinase